MMRKILFAILLFIPGLVFSQNGAGGPDCASMEPICSDLGSVQFTANSGVAEASDTDPGNDYGCLFTQPNPSWYYLEIATAGDLEMNLTAASDIDYIIWGPYSSLSEAQAECGNHGDPPNNNEVDCSYSSTNDEYPTITGTQVGEVYVMLVTNYADVVQDISLTQIGGSASTNCTIVTDPPCAIVSFDVSVSGCEFATGTYDISGTITFTDAPGGQLIVEDCYGNNINAGNNVSGDGTQSFSINNIAADGATCSLTAYFANDPTCTQTFQYVAPVCVNNCPTYDLQAVSPTEACGDQIYYMEIQNSGCDGFISFDVTGNYGTYATEISWEITSNLTNDVVASGAGSFDGQAINVSVGSIDPNSQGLIYTLCVYDSYGDGFSGNGGNAGHIEVEQGGTTLTSMSGNFGSSGCNIFQAGVIVSSSTITVQTPNGPVVSQISNCQDHEVAIPLNNTNYCTQTVVDLPWEIVCDNSGTLIASGTQTVTVYPQIPTSGADLVTLSWNAATCTWDVSPQNDCNMIDIGVVFDISPDPASFGAACTDGTETFTIDYLGFTNGPNCCQTGGPVGPITTSYYSNDPSQESSPFGGTNNSAYFIIPANGDGGNATSINLDISMSGYCFNPPSTGTNDDYWVTVYIDGVIILDQIYSPPPTGFSESFNLSDYPSFNENSVVEVYIYPNSFGIPGPPGPGINTTYDDGGGDCITDAYWDATNIEISLDVNYEQVSTSPANCTFLTTEAYTCCSLTPLGGTPPGPASVATVAAIPPANVNLVTGVTGDCNPVVTWLGDGPLVGGCGGTVTRTYRIINDCGQFVDLTQVFTIVNSVVVTTTSVAPTCGLCNGTASVTSNTGGTTPYSYLWSNGQTTQSIASLCAGTYDVTITDGIGCVVYGSEIITSPPAMVLNLVPTNATCGANNGSISVQVTNGSPTYDIDWAPGGSINNQNSPYPISPLAPGNYGVTVTDNVGCTISGTAAIIDVGTVVAGFNYNGNQCLTGNSFNFNNTGSTGGAETYSWTFTGGTPATSTNEDPTNITWSTPGTYAVTQTITAGSCTDSETINITVYPQPTGTFTITDPSCNGICDGQAQTAPANGSAPYTYNWSNGQTSQTATGLCDGNYTVTITDANLCSGTAIAVLTEPAPLDLTATRTNVLCSGLCTGTANVIVNSGGTPGFTYNWGAGTTPTNASTGGLCAGIYTVTVTDSNGCTETANVTITQPASALSLAISGNNLSCNGVCDGDATVVASNGTPGYTYSWSGGGGTAAAATSLCAGSYTVTVTDLNLCTATANINITQPAVLSVAVTGSNVTCNGLCNGTVAANPSGGTSGYSYSWNNGAGTGSSANGLCANTYAVTVTDANLCTATGSYTVTENPAVTASVTGNDVSCNNVCDGDATVTPGGGTGSYTYLWSNGQTNATATALCDGTFNVTVTDSDGCTATSSVTINENPAVTASVAGNNVSCNAACDGDATVTPDGGTGSYTYLWSNGQTNANATALCAGGYNVTVTDSDGCTATASVTITENPAVTASASGNDVSCNGVCNGNATVTPGGGTGAGTYSYLWSNGATTQLAGSLCAGGYTVTVTDGDGCIATTSVTINQNPAVTATTSANDVSCNSVCDGDATVTPGGGTGSYTYLWSNGQTNANATALCDGNYNVTVTDSDGCSATASATINENPAVTASATGNDVSCNAACDGDATVTPGGGTGSYTYLWSNGQTNANATALCAGSYNVTVTDSDGCTATVAVTINENPAVTASATSNDVSCNGVCNGNATVTPSGGTGAGTYSYLWSNGAATPLAGSLCAGGYSVTVTDGDGCTATTSVTINENPALTTAATGNDASCNGVCDGDATVTPGGGTGVGTYSYSWDDPLFSTTAGIGSLCAGTYNVTVTDGNGCTITDLFVVNEPPAMVLTPSSVDAVCGSPSGSASVSVAGGTPSYSYDWAPNGFTDDGTDTYTDLPSGNYTVTVTDANGCTEDIAISVNDAGSPVVAISASTNVTCNGLCDGTAEATITTPSTSPYNYVWSNGSSTPPTANLTDNVTALCAGNITVTVTDNLGCNATATITITQNPVMNATITASTNVSCNAACDGSATVSVNGGTGVGTYSYLWTGGQTSATASGLCAGTYTVTATDGNGCTVTKTVIINENPAVTASATGNDVSCNAGCNGDATVTPGGGTGSYSYLWNNGQTSLTASSLCAGSYTVTVTDSDGCTAISGFTVNENPAVTASVSGNDVSCNAGCDGDATVTPGGGTGAYTYLWNDSQTGLTATGLCAGSYTLTVTDGNGCTAIASVAINENPALTSTISGNDVSCNAACDGDATVVPSGGTGAGTYSYLWGDGQTNSNATALCAGAITVTVTDGNGCTASTGITINENPAVTASATGNDVSCNGICNGSASITAGGGTGAGTYSFLWSTGQTTQTANALCAGSYTATVTDLDGCTATTSVTINENPSVTASISGSNDVTIAGLCDGNATVLAGGGTGAGTYTYLWNDPGAQTSTTAAALCAGTYTVTVTDANGCTATATITINEPNALVVLSSTVAATCNGYCDGSAEVNVQGGVLPYSFQWSDPASQTDSIATGLCAGSYNVTITDSNGAQNVTNVNITEPSIVVASIADSAYVSCNGLCDGSASATALGGTVLGAYSYLWDDPGAQTTPTASGLCAGTYNVVVTDNNGCTASASILIAEPGLLTASITQSNNVSCFSVCDGSATVSAADGTPGYTYLWNDPGAQTTTTASNLCAGSFNVTVTDANGCTTSVPVSITQPTILLASTSKTDAHCGLPDGDATVTPSGGTAGYTYSWDDLSAQSTQTASNLITGVYSVTVTDANGCTATASANVGNLSGVSSNITDQNNVSCNGVCDADATVEGAGGNTPYTYLWDDPSGQTTQIANALCAGTYNVTITDSDGCFSVSSVTITEPTVLTANISSSSNVSCNSGNDGTATVSQTGGTAPYTYVWDGGAAPLASANTGLVAGTFNVTVTDNNGCTATTSVLITQPTPIVLTMNGDDENCLQANGWATVSATGGTVAGDYVYSWSAGTNPTTDSISNIGAGTYTVTVTDDNGCSITGLQIINNIPPGTITISSYTDASCNGVCDGIATASTGGGLPPYSYLWDDPSSQTTATATGLCAGTYNVSVTDANNCIVSTTATISEPVVLSNSIAFSNIQCFGDCNGAVTANTSGGTAPYTYQWDDPVLTINQTVNNLCSGTYHVSITDANGCEMTDSVDLNDPSPVSVIVDSIIAANCGQNDGSVYISIQDGNPPFIYSWNNGTFTTEDLTGIPAGSYSVIVTDLKGCTATASSIVPDETGPTASISAIQNVDCNGSCNGSATVVGTGGTGVGTYTYMWSDPSSQTSSIATNLCAGNYNVTITDANGCISSANAIITQPAVLAANYFTDDVNCNAACDGSASATPFGGTAPYSYQWSDPGAQTGSQAVNLCAGQYNVTITDDHGCTITNNLTINEPAFIALSTSKTDVNCFGASDGTATVSAIGGTVTGSYGYIWDDPSAQTTQTAIGLSNGTFCVTVSDNNGCTESICVNITTPTQLTAQINNFGDVSCNGFGDGFAQVNVTGGEPNYTFLWNNTETTQTITGINGGNYSVLVTDANGCTQITSITIAEPSQLLLTLDPTNESCYGYCNGSIDALISGGTQNYNILWSNLQTSTTAINLCPNNYSVLVTDANGCTATANTTITGPPLLEVINPNVTGANCGQANGSASVQINGGTSPTSYEWQDATYNTISNSLGISNVTAGAYSFTVTDFLGCEASLSISISNLTGPTIDSITVSNVNCYGNNNGTATVYASGGDFPYTYHWNDPMNQATQTAINLPGNVTYTVNVTDFSGCTASQTVLVTQPQVLISAIVNNTPVSCFGGSNGSATVQAAGGTNPLSYLWTPTAQVTANATGLSAGNYNVIVTDANGCTSTTNTTINEPSLLIVSQTITDVSCYGGSDGAISLLTFGGTQPPAFNWLPPASGTNSVASGLSAGTYNVVVSDANFCTQLMGYSVSEPNPIIVTTSSTPVTCNSDNGTASADNISGGTPGYTYMWSPGNFTTSSVSSLSPGTYILQVEDFNGCTEIIYVDVQNIPPPSQVILATTDAGCSGGFDGEISSSVVGGQSPYTYLWNNGQTTQTAFDLSAGQYSVIITDANGCTVSNSASINDPDPVVAILTGPSETVCIGQSVNMIANASGGTPPYLYYWADTNLVASNAFQTIQPEVSTTYQVSVVDANGCQGISAFETVNVYGPLSLNTIAQPSIICEGESAVITAIATGGNGGPYFYYWEGVIGGTYQAVSPASTSLYNIIVSDGCSPQASDSVLIEVMPKPAVNFIANVYSGCEPLQVEFQNVPDPLITFLEWNFGDYSSGFNESNESNPSHIYEDDGVYDVTLFASTEFGCTNEYTWDNMITVYPNPIAAFSYNPNSPQAFDATVQFFDLSDNAAFWLWDFGDGTNNITGEYPIHTYQYADTFNVHLDVWTEHGCYDSTSMPLIVKPVHTFYAPTAFTPNLGGSDTERNPYWTPEGTGIDDCPECYKLWIFDRWGEIIWESDEFYGNTHSDEHRWNGRYFNKGRICQIGVYTWYCVLQDVNGYQHDYVGTVTIIR